MPNAYDINTKPILVRPHVRTAAKLSVYARRAGMSRSSAASRLLDSHPAIDAITLDEDGLKEVDEMIAKNKEGRVKRKNRYDPSRPCLQEAQHLLQALTRYLSKTILRP